MRPARSETEVISPPSTRVSRWTTGSATDQDPRWHLGPRLERPGLRHGCPRLLRLATPQGLLTDPRRDVMEVQGRVVVGGLSRQPKGGQVGEHLLLLAGV